MAKLSFAQYAYNNFRKWTDDGTIKRIFDKIAPKREERVEIQLDGTYVRAHQHSAGVKKLQASQERRGKTARG